MIHVWLYDRYWSELSCGTFTIPLHDTNAKVTDLYVFCYCIALKFLKVLGFAKPLMDLIRIWHGDRNFSKILHDTIRNADSASQYNVTDLECFGLIFTVSDFAKPLMD